MSSNNMADPKRPNKVLRYKPPTTETNPTLEDPTPDYMNLLGMIFSMCGLMLKAVHLSRGHVLPPEPTANVAAVVTPASCPYGLEVKAGGRLSSQEPEQTHRGTRRTLLLTF
ncbi:protein Asterix isoform X1 [Dunckerocampus dactyliophorus]|uniref:protein Asterix isoform X1 n=1 Tax=Dunckerocampus dactyliophorus TaxID=161453 RepID=UPI002404FF6A|nr:protein Asterix isoform X1 [Dunckerocampus dactyliophorus]